ncbi:chemotaxis protein CheW [Rhodoblastus acidophilus]|uniref:Chemotaxis protein CheW n=1 Tax=Rhodoblastus acidophilus TaxID=1074 RepID=A0A6N8DHD3_RHOAC|nr:chemotaxis protein CheW [Rhodoblastus acidophilus]MCW2272885.1 purine-binding chemotaxis protein CheW [Rhodoblastus acidophilus]MTV29792.1 chemotaxis protein CheW [Rhodoblastus acidophilus]
MSAVAEALETLKAEFAPEQAAREKNMESGADARQFVIFHVQGERFGVSLSEVQEIIRVPDVVRMPLSPASLEGLANLRGNVLPVLSLRQVFGFPAAINDDSTRVVVLNHERPVGLIVDRMANVVTVEPERIEQASTIRSSIDVDFVSGMIKEIDGRSMVIILNSRKIVGNEFSRRLDRAVNAGQDAAHQAEQGETAAADDAEEDQLVSFEVAGQEYAFPIETVKEIVQLPDHITEVPNTAGHILGVITLRNKLLPLVSLRAFFGMRQGEMTEANKVVVIALDEAGDASVGVVMDSIRAVLRVKRDEVEEVPELLRGRGDNISGICRLDQGRRLVSVLSAETMFDRAEIEKLRHAGDADMNEAGQSATVASIDAVDEEQFVVFRLKGEEYGVRIDAVQEIVRVPSELTRIPSTPDFIEGVINLRGAVLPVVDQRRRFRMESVERNDRQRIMVFTLNGVKTGFIVDFVSEVRRIPLSAIAPAPQLSEEQRRIIRKVANLENEKRMILLLDVVQLLNAEEISDMRASMH